MIKTKNESYSVCAKIPLALPIKIARQLDKQIDIPASFYETQIQSLNKVITDEEVCKRIANVNSLTLEITQNCNLRCRYCGYSGLYQSYRTHQSKSMPLKTAKRAAEPNRV